jgi:hypothetical protein
MAARPRLICKHINLDPTCDRFFYEEGRLAAHTAQCHQNAVVNPLPARRSVKRKRSYDEWMAAELRSESPVPMEELIPEEPAVEAAPPRRHGRSYGPCPKIYPEASGGTPEQTDDEATLRSNPFAPFQSEQHLELACWLLNDYSSESQGRINSLMAILGGTKKKAGLYEGPPSFKDHDDLIRQVLRIERSHPEARAAWKSTTISPIIRGDPGKDAELDRYKAQDHCLFHRDSIVELAYRLAQDKQFEGAFDWQCYQDFVDGDRIYREMASGDNWADAQVRWAVVCTVG